MITVEGYLNKVIFHNKDNNYSILSIFLSENYDFINGDYLTVVGTFDTDFEEEELYLFKGDLVTHKKFGIQMTAVFSEKIVKKDTKSIIDYLSGETFPGIGKKTAELIVEQLGVDCLDKIYSNKNLLFDIENIPNHKKDIIYSNIINNRQSQDTILKLTELGLKNNLINKIYNQYKTKAIEIIKNTPYELIKTIRGIGFSTIDKIAEKIGIPEDDAERIKYAILSEISNICYSSGNTYIESKALLYSSYNLLYKSRPIAIDKDRIINVFEETILNGELIKIDNKIFLPEIYYAEHYIYMDIKERLDNTREKINDALLDLYIAEIEEELLIKYDIEQIKAIKTSINENFSILTGGPGTGKTTIILAIIKIFQKINNYSYNDLLDETKSLLSLCAPTGKAAKRMTESTGFYASTIHKAIGWTSEDDSITEFSSDKKIKSKLVIIDESSMIDVFLMQNLLKIINKEAQIIVVGDTQQLPSISPGNVLNDLILSEKIPTTQLNKIFRQSENSSIIKLSYSIKNNIYVDILENYIDRTFRISNKEDILNEIIDQYSKILKTTSYEKVQILVPIYKGPYGIHSINKLIQEKFNTNTISLEYGDFLFKVNDRVMQLVNRTEDNVFNGDIGIITDIFKEDNKDKITVNFDNIYITYEKQDLKELMLAYACSIHKSQGSEFEHVIVPLVDNYMFMYNKNLIYTAITRAKEKLYLCGNPNTFYFSIAPDNIVKRNSFLKNLFSDKTLDIKEETYILNMDNIYSIDPMIGMENIILSDDGDK